MFTFANNERCWCHNFVKVCQCFVKSQEKNIHANLETLTSVSVFQYLCKPFAFCQYVLNWHNWVENVQIISLYSEGYSEECSQSKAHSSFYCRAVGTDQLEWGTFQWLSPGYCRRQTSVTSVQRTIFPGFFFPHFSILTVIIFAGKILLQSLKP